MSMYRILIGDSWCVGFLTMWAGRMGVTFFQSQRVILTCI